MAFKGYKRTIQLDFDYDKVKDGVPKAAQQMALLNSEFAKATAQAQATGTAFDKLALANDKLKNQVSIQSDKVNKLQSELNSLTSAENKNEKAIASKQIALNNATAALARMQEEYKRSNSAMEETNTVTGKLKLGFESLSLGAERAGVDLNKTFSDLAKYSAVAGVAVAGTIKAFISFDDEMIKSRTIMDENQISYEDMRNNVLKVSKDVNVSATTLAQANYDILSSNVSTADSNGVLYQSAILAKTGFTDVATAADILTSIMNGYNKSADEAKGIVDGLIQTQNVGKLTIGQLSSSMGDLIGIASSSKIPLEQVEAGIAAMTLSGIKASTAIADTKQIIGAIVKPTAEATKAAEEMGIKMSAAALESKGLAGWLEDAMKKTGGSTEKFAQLFGSMEALSGVLAVTNNNGKTFNDALEKIKDSAGIASESFKTLENSSGEKLRSSLNNLSNQAIKLGETFSPLVEILSDLVGFLAGIPTEVVLLVAGMATAAMILKTVSAVLIAVGASGLIAGTGITALGTSMASVVPIILIVAAVIGLVVGLIAAISGRAKEASSSMSNLAQNSKDAAQNAAKATSNTVKKGNYATGTNFVKEDGWYRLNEYGQEEVYLNRGSRIKNAEQTRYESEGKANDMSETNNLLRQLIGKFESMDNTLKDSPRQQLRYAREMGV